MNSEIVLSSWRYLLPFYAPLRFTLITLSRVLRQYLRRNLRDAFLVHNILVESVEKQQTSQFYMKTVYIISLGSRVTVSF